MSNLNHRLAKKHRSYTVHEVARLYSVHKNTVHAWIKSGLPTCDEKRPILILGSHLGNFLKARRAKRKQPCKPDEIYCLRCRIPRVPAGYMADYSPLNHMLGVLSGICPVCESIITQRKNRAKLLLLCEKLDVRFPLGLERLIKSQEPRLNSDLEGTTTH